MSVEFVYVLGHPDGHKKIGFSSNPLARLSQLQAASPVPLSAIHIVSCHDGNAYQLEQRVHAILAAARQEREWFSVDLERAIEAIAEAAADIGAEVHARDVHEVRRLRSEAASPPREPLQAPIIREWLVLRGPLPRDDLWPFFAQRLHPEYEDEANSYAYSSTPHDDDPPPDDEMPYDDDLPPPD